jgi:hypothetical protein
MVIDPQTLKTFYAGVSLYGVFKSTDGGATWHTTNLPLPVNDASAISLAIHPAIPSTVYAGTFPTVRRLLRRVGLATRRARLAVLEHQAVQTARLLTEHTRRRLWRARA